MHTKSFKFALTTRATSFWPPTSNAFVLAMHARAGTGAGMGADTGTGTGVDTGAAGR